MIEVSFKHLNIEIELNIKDSFAILGPNGSGKSILLNVITHSLYPEKLFKRKVFGKTLTLNEAREVFGVVNSELEYFYRNENITIFDAVISSFKRALLVYNFYDFSKDEIDKTYEILEKFKLNPNQNISTLSLGELKRAMIARAIVHNPKILCFDEITNGLDIKNKIELLDFIFSLNKKIIYITHNFDELGHFNYIVMLKDGKIFKEGKDILTKENIKNLFDLDEKHLKVLYG